jgi:alanine racemase
MRPSGHKVWLEISRSALQHNARSLKRLVGKRVELIAVVKSNAYGHGLPEVVRAVGGIADRFAVDSLSEAEAVRRSGSRLPVLILGYTPIGDLPRAVRQGFGLTVYNPASIRAAAKAATASRPAKIHLKVETGTSRQGILAKDLAATAKLMRRVRNLKVEGTHTHYANIEDTSDPSYAMLQLKRFKEALALFESLGIRPQLAHTASSAAAILYPVTRLSAVRAGIALYGLWPSEQVRQTCANGGIDLKLKPAMTWKTAVAQVKELPAGTPVSYGLTERLTRDSRVAVLPVGYWDGFDRGLSSVGEVLIRGERCRVLGRVCMNMCVVDVTGLKSAKPEDEAVLVGRQGRDEISAEEFAAWLGTINYEAVTRVNPALKRILVK